MVPQLTFYYQMKIKGYTGKLEISSNRAEVIFLALSKRDGMLGRCGGSFYTPVPDAKYSVRSSNLRWLSVWGSGVFWTEVSKSSMRSSNPWGVLFWSRIPYSGIFDIFFPTRSSLVSQCVETNKHILNPLHVNLSETDNPESTPLQCCPETFCVCFIKIFPSVKIYTHILWLIAWKNSSCLFVIL